MEDMRQFLEAMETMGPGLLFEEGGKEGWDKIDPAKKAAVEAAGIKAVWPYEPEGYDLLVLEHSKDGEQKNSWSVVFFTEAEAASKEPEEKIFDDMMYEAKPAAGVMKIIEQAKGNFLDTVQLCIELASNKSMKGGFSKAKVSSAVAAAKRGVSKGGAKPAGKASAKPMGKPMGKKPSAEPEEEEEEEG